MIDEAVWNNDGLITGRGKPEESEKMLVVPPPPLQVSPIVSGD
jgi:hypothetical protein